MADLVRKQLRSVTDLPIVSSSLAPLDFGNNKVSPGPKGYRSMFEQILDCLERSEGDTIYFCEADVLYPAEHFDFEPPDQKFWYNNNWWKVFPDGTAVSWEADQVSGLVCNRVVAVEWYRTRIATLDDSFDRKYEPESGHGSRAFMTETPLVDIRHRGNLTYSKRSLDHFRDKTTAVNFREGTIADIPGWSLSVEDIY